MHRDITRAARGFTLIELMIVVTIIGILAAIAVPVYLNYAAKAQFAEATSLASGAKTAVVEAYAARNTMNGLNNGVDSIPDATEMSGTYVERVDVANGVITATFGVGSALAGDTVTLTPHPADGAIRWRCSTSAPAAKSPASCR